MGVSAAVIPLKTTVIGQMRDYVLVEEIGRGAHGVVYRGYAAGNAERPVAVKVVEDNSSIDRLLVEPQLLSKLKHPNVVTLQDYFLHGGKVVLVTEYVPGCDLGAYFERHGQFSPAEVREFLHQMASAISHAHAAGVFHSDLKPKNILVDTSNGAHRYVIADFGVSRLATGIQCGRYIAGTCAFMAPEQLRGRVMQSDLWALGAIAYMLLTGTLPFNGRTLEELRKRIQFDQPHFPPDVAASDAGLERAISHLLEKNVIDRYSSADDLLNDLGAVPIDQLSPNDTLMADTPQWERRLQAEIAKYKRKTILWALAASLPDVIPGVISCIGVYVIFRGQVRRRHFEALVGFALFGVAAWVGMQVEVLEDYLLGSGASDALVAVDFLFGLLAFFAASQFVLMRRAQRELTLLRSLRSGDREQVLKVLGSYVNSSKDDMNMWRRYIEALLAAGRIEEGVVEAKLTLEADPYNLHANLLLANAYMELGLIDRCEQVCNGYLEISPQCFEFEELRAMALRTGKAIA